MDDFQMEYAAFSAPVEKDSKPYKIEPSTGENLYLINNAKYIDKENVSGRKLSNREVSVRSNSSSSVQSCRV